MLTPEFLTPRTLYGRSGTYDDTIYTSKNFEKKSDELGQLIQKYKKSPGAALTRWVPLGRGLYLAV